MGISENDSPEHLSDDEIVDRVEGRISLTREQRRFRRWIYGLMIVGATTIAAVAATTSVVIFVETNKEKQAAPEKVEKKSPYEIAFHNVTKEECMRKGYKFTENGLILPGGELLGPAENIQSVTLLRNGGGQIIYSMKLRVRNGDAE